MSCQDSCLIHAVDLRWPRLGRPSKKSAVRVPATSTEGPAGPFGSFRDAGLFLASPVGLLESACFWNIFAIETRGSRGRGIDRRVLRNDQGGRARSATLDLLGYSRHGRPPLRPGWSRRTRLF